MEMMQLVAPKFWFLSSGFFQIYINHDKYQIFYTCGQNKSEFANTMINKLLNNLA